MASEGASVTINDIDPEPAEQTVKDIEKAGGKATYCIADITTAEGAEKLLAAAVDKFGKLDILVNNAGIIRDAAIHKMTDTQWDVCMDICLKGSFNCVRAAAKYMRREDGNCRIVNISSISGLWGNPGQINYSSAKAGVIGLTKVVAREWAHFGVRCNAVAYGLVDTRLTKDRDEAEIVQGEKVGMPKNARDAAITRYGGKIITPEDAARPVLFLVTKDAEFVTGNVIHVAPPSPTRFM
jgi:3-oxoacyl-[acyl-carrier protein] reductase